MARDQAQVLNALDVAKTQWYHFTAIIVAGMGFFTDAYDLFSISLVTKLLGRVCYYVEGSPQPGTLLPNAAAAVNGVAFCGTISGQLYLVARGQIGAQKSVRHDPLDDDPMLSLFGPLFWTHVKICHDHSLLLRFWLGFGIGGDYPLSATIMSEYSSKKTWGAFMSAVFAMQSFGILAAGIFAIILSGVLKTKFPAATYEVDPAGSTVSQADFVWRLMLMAGAVPAVLTFYSRSKMPETARYTALVAKNAERATADMVKVLQVEIASSEPKVDESNNKVKS